ncbi:MAG TPA: ATP-binding protein [Azospirillaceae bacterium]|nr:ATP-binding protein [Azospirillaceae bacterium]
MRWLASLTLSAKMFLAFGFFFLVTVGLGVVAVQQLRAVNAGAQGLQSNWLPSTRALGDLNHVVSELRAAEGAYIIAISEEGSQAALSARERALAQVAVVRARYEALPRGPEEQALYDHFLAGWQAYMEVSEAVLSVARESKPGASRLYRLQSLPAYQEAIRRLVRLTDYNVAGGVQAAVQSEQAYESGLRFVISTLVIHAVLVVLATLLFSRVFVRPIVRMTAAMQALAGRDTGVPTPDLDRRDEIGSMARSVEVFRHNALELARSREQLATQASMLSDALDREREIVAVQRNFVGMASHEFRTPLTVIDGQAHRILKRLDMIGSDELSERVGKIRQAAARMTRVIDGFFRMARAPEGQIPFEPADVALAELIEEAGRYIQSDAEAGRVRCELGGLPATVRADAALLRQVFDNLLDNALKYSPPGSPVLVTGTVAEARAVVTVADRGIGLPERDRDRLFERFFRADNTGGVAGTGVGLHIVRVLVELHGGTVAARNREGGGAEFTVSLPLASAAVGAQVA